MPNLPYIPTQIVVHLGAPDEPAPNVTVDYDTYLKNVASSEIYPTWPDASLRANIYAQNSYALNRFYTEYYRSRGYDFDITNTPAYDQTFINNREIFGNISTIVNDLLTSYIVRQGNIEPLFAQYCDGTTTTCEGLSQWGTVSLAEQGFVPYDILTYYYGNNINLVTDAEIRGYEESVPDTLLSIGSVGSEVRTIQLRLNRIAANYPAIPKIQPVDGIFDVGTDESVRAFQRIFGITEDGIVGRTTWYTILKVYNSVKKLNELVSEGLTFDDVSTQYTEQIGPGDSGLFVQVIQYYIDFISDYDNTIPEIVITGVYDAATENAIRAFQELKQLEVTGIVNEATWEALYNSYAGIFDSLPLNTFTGSIPYPGEVITLGTQDESVTILQQYLNTIAQVLAEVPSVEVTGVYDEATQYAILEFQRLFGIDPSGVVGPITWATIASEYDDIVAEGIPNEGQYPGYVLEENNTQ